MDGLGRLMAGGCSHPRVEVHIIYPTYVCRLVDLDPRTGGLTRDSGEVKPGGMHADAVVRIQQFHILHDRILAHNVQRVRI